MSQAAISAPLHQHLYSRPKKGKWPVSALGSAAMLLLGCPLILWYMLNSGSTDLQARSEMGSPPQHFLAPILVSYSYFEKDPVQVRNFEFFLAAGTLLPMQGEVFWSFVVNGESCSPCSALIHFLARHSDDVSHLEISDVYRSENFQLLFRSKNYGMDIAAHNVTVEFLKYMKEIDRFSYFVFLNSSVKGPFMPSYMPRWWHWTYAYLTRMGGGIHAVSSSLTCLPETDLGGPGPRLESWAFAVDRLGFQALLEDEVMHRRTCKLCQNGIVVQGEYGLTRSQFKRGYNVATLMSKYAINVDWRQDRLYRCNNNVHPSRHGTYDGISQHPFELVFVKSSWHVADPYTSKYSQWRLLELADRDTTDGHFDRAMYMYAISPEAQLPHNVEQCYSVKVA